MELEKKVLVNSQGDQYLAVFFDSEIQATTDVWTGPFETEENFFRGLHLIKENIKHFGSTKWLADLSRIEGSFDFARDYISHQLVPEAMRYGLLYEALIVPNTILPMLAVQETLVQISDFQIRIFGSTEEAKRWLNSRDPRKHPSNKHYS